jgi:hypothetical protein
MACRAHSVPPLERLLRVRRFARASPADRQATRRVPPALLRGLLAAFGNQVSDVGPKLVAARRATAPRPARPFRLLRIRRRDMLELVNPPRYAMSANCISRSFVRAALSLAPTGLGGQSNQHC